MSDLEAHEVPLSKIFSSDYEFRIPDYQRPYSWGVEQSTQLLNDLTETLDRGDTEPYFLGSMVLVKTKGSPQSEVIDGQQRLTTLTLLLSVLRSLTQEDDLKKDFGEMLMEPGKKILGLAAKPRLTLRSRDSAFFRKWVQEPLSLDALLSMKPDVPKNDAQANIQRNTEALWTELKDWDEHRRFDLSRLLLNRTFLVSVSTPDLSSAHRIFSVMNSRGLDLSPADIFKADVIGQLPEPDADHYASKWEDAEEALGRQAFADLFLHIRMIYAKSRATRELLKEFPEQVLDQYLPERAKEFVDEVVIPYADALQVIRQRNYTSASGADSVNQWLKRLSLTDNNDWVPVAMWALHHHGDDPEWLDQFLARLERLAASLLLRRVYATPRATRYASLLRQLDAGHGLDSEALVLGEEEREEARDVLQGNIYGIAPVRKFVLQRLEELVAKEPGVTFNHKIITVEHVLPQNPEPDSHWVRLFDETKRNQWTNRLANLVLLNRRKNSEAQNLDFEDKKTKYFNSEKGVPTFSLTIQVLNAKEWTPETLKDRQSALTSVLESAWQLR